ncbi:MAG TPA: hypothetical protein VGG99_12535 [Acetobacteraceae bacterium]|jgi:hypothetical protein
MSKDTGNTRYDFNVLEKTAGKLLESGRPYDAMRIYLFMADRDNSLDGGRLGERIGGCLERLGDRYSAKFWYGRAVEENPGIPVYVEARKRLEGLNIDDLVPPDDYIRPLKG